MHKEIPYGDGPQEDKIVIQVDKVFRKVLDPPKHGFDRPGIEGWKRLFIALEDIPVINNGNSQLAAGVLIKTAGSLVIGDQEYIPQPRGKLSKRIKAPADFAPLLETRGDPAGHDPLSIV